jgi:two-component system, NtrC family, nitrogen regulation response regulator NtrX
VLLDIWMPDADGISLLREWSKAESIKPCPVVMMSGHGTVETAVEATRLGAFDFIEKPVSLAKLLRTVERALESGRVPGRATRQIGPTTTVPVGRSRLIQALREQSERVAAHDTSVLITGEPGSGRESFAHFIHSLSPRSAGPFVRLVASALPDAGAEALLFGRESNGGTEQGYLERARGGTLFINELADLGPAAQRLLHGALESGRFTPAGSTAPQPVDVRIISSAAPGFEQAPPGGPFRRELLTDLAVVVLKVPPLRDYAEDVPELLRHFLDQLVDTDGLPFRRLGVAAQNRLRNYPWPGNVRELRNLVRRLLIMGGGKKSVSTRSSRFSPRKASRTKVCSAGTSWRCRCARRASSSNAPICSNSCSCATARWASSRSASAWSARTSIASCAPWASISAAAVPTTETAWPLPGGRPTAGPCHRHPGGAR